MKTINPELAREIAQKLTQTPREERNKIIGEYAEILGWSATKLYRLAEAHGFESGRRIRKDKGVTKTGIGRDTVRLGAAMILGSKRQTENIIMSTWKMMEIMGDNGKIEHEAASESWFNRQFRNEHITKQDVKKPLPAIFMASKHPNHVHQLDFSICIQYDFKEKGTRWKMVDRDMQKQFYKNKPGYWKKVKKVLIRALLTDHCSGVIYPKYYYVSGEDTKMLVDFTLSAWGKKPEPELFPFHGVPLILMVDPGSANIGQVYKNLMKGLRVRLEVHFPGHARVKGQVESSHAFWERAFESELSIKKAMDIIELNTRAHDYAMYLNASKKHRRHGMTRFGAWQNIAQEELRILPNKEACFALCSYDPAPAVIDGRKCIQFDGKLYQVKGPFRLGDRVWVHKNPYAEPYIDVSDKKEKGEFFPVELIYTNKYGFNVNAQIIGEGHKSHPEDTTAQFVKAVEKKEICLEGIEPKLQREKIEKIAYIERQGTAIDITAETQRLQREERRGTIDEGRGTRDEGCGAMRRKDAEMVTTITYSRHEVFGEIRHRLKLERILPLQSELIDKILDNYCRNNTPPAPSQEGKLLIPDTVIEEICREIFRKVQIVETVQTVQTAQAVTA